MNSLILFAIFSAVSATQAQESQPSIKPVTVQQVIRVLKNSPITREVGRFKNGQPCEVEIKDDPLAKSYFIGMSSGNHYFPEQSIRLYRQSIRLYRQSIRLNYGTLWFANREDRLPQTTYTFVENSRARNPKRIVLRMLLARQDISDFELTIQANGESITCSYQE
jgi:hypothetical protein